MTRRRIHAACLLGLAPTLVVGFGCLLRPDLTKDLWPLMLGLAALATLVLTLVLLAGWWLANRFRLPLRRPLEVGVAVIALLTIGVPAALAPLMLAIVWASVAPRPPDTNPRPLLRVFPEPERPG